VSKLRIQNRSPILIFCLTLSFIVSTVAFTLADSREAGSPQPAPRAVTPFTSFNFGDVYTGEVISQIFIVRNAGDADLQITDFVAGCGCEAIQADRVIPPGKDGTAVVEVQTISQIGDTVKTATLHTNDPERPRIILTLIANVLRGRPLRTGKYIGPVFLSPGSFASLYALNGKKATTEFSITSDKPVKVVRVDSATKHFTARIEEVEPGRNYKLVVESVPTETGDLYKDQLRVITDCEALPAFTIDLALKVYPKQ
jgi:hypothetical protein